MTIICNRHSRAVLYRNIFDKRMKNKKKQNNKQDEGQCKSYWKIYSNDKRFKRISSDNIRLNKVLIRDT